MFGSQLEQAGFGLIGGKKQITLAIRGIRKLSPPSDESPAKSTAIYRQMSSLPRTTLGAWGMQADPVGWFRALIPQESRGAARFYRDLMIHAAGGGDIENDLLSKLGPQVVWIWGQTGDEAPGIPRIALKLESRDARECSSQLTDWVQRMVAVLKPGDMTDESALGDQANESENPPLVRVSEYIGLSVTTLPLERIVPDSDRKSSLGTLLAELSPSWTALDGWLVIALSEEHLREIIDAHRRFAPTLGQLVDVVGLDQVRRGSAELALFQPSLAAEVLRAWSEGLVSGKPSFLDPEVWGRSTTTNEESPQRPRRLGIGVASQMESPGKVTIERVYPDEPAAGRMQAGDKILGVNGTVLPLKNTLAELRQMTQAALRERTVALRVERDGQLVDVVIPLRRPGSDDALQALEKFAQAGADIPFASYSVLNAKPERFHANITLNFR
jgi:hypothetical protein